MALLSSAALFSTGCGYHLQTSENPLSTKEGVRKIYIAPLINNTYKTGVENTVYNALLRTMTAHRRVLVVSDPEAADAVLAGTVTVATVFSVAASGSFPRGVPISSQYNATLACAFNLIRRNPRPGQRGLIWTWDNTRSKPFASAAQTNARNETTALINDSEFDEALSEVAIAMMEDVHESMLALF